MENHHAITVKGKNHLFLWVIYTMAMLVITRPGNIPRIWTQLGHFGGWFPESSTLPWWYVPSSKHGIWAMVIHPILGIITMTMGILNPIDGCMTIPFYEKKKCFDHGTYVLGSMWSVPRAAIRDVYFFLPQIVIYEKPSLVVFMCLTNPKIIKSSQLYYGLW